MAGLVPSLLLALFGAWCGTFAWGATWQGSAAAALSLLGVLAWAGSPWRDPLRLGATGRFLPAALWIAVAASAWASPAPRAGWQAVVLLPAFLAFPGTVNRCWRGGWDPASWRGSNGRSNRISAPSRHGHCPASSRL